MHTHTRRRRRRRLYKWLSNLVITLTDWLTDWQPGYWDSSPGAIGFCDNRFLADKFNSDSTHYPFTCHAAHPKENAKMNYIWILFFFCQPWWLWRSPRRTVEFDVSHGIQALPPSFPKRTHHHAWTPKEGHFVRKHPYTLSMSTCVSCSSYRFVPCSPVDQFKFSERWRRRRRSSIKRE